MTMLPLVEVAPECFLLNKTIMTTEILYSSKCYLLKIISLLIMKSAMTKFNMGVSIPILDSSRRLTLIFASDIFSSWAAFSFAMAAFNSAFANS